MIVIIENSYMTNKEYVERLLNSVARKLMSVSGHIDVDVDEEIIYAEILNCKNMLENVLENITLEED